MPGIHRETDVTTGHDCWPPTIPATWSNNVFVNSLGAVRFGDPIVPHTCPPIPETHSNIYVGPNNNVYVNSRLVQYCGAPVACGDHAGLKITDIQISGKKRMDVASLLNGSHPIEVGKKFN